MPIQFRCSSCQKILSISSKKAGAKIVCPACTEEIRVPSPGDAPAVSADIVQSSGAQGAWAAGGEVETQDTRSTAKAGAARPAGGAYSSEASSQHKPLFDEEPDHEHEHDEDEAGHTPHPKKKRFMDDTVDMTAMVDVTFLLLIFFMVTASFAAQKVFEASPPEQEVEEELSDGAVGVASEDVATESVVLEIDASDRMKIEDQTISSLFELREVLSGKFGEGKSELLIESDYDATHGIVVAVTDAAMDVGMQKIRRMSKKSE